MFCEENHVNVFVLNLVTAAKANIWLLKNEVFL